MTTIDLNVMALMQLETSSTREALTEFIETIRRHCELDGIAYFCASFRGYSLVKPFIVRTQGAEWTDAYTTKGCAMKDPLVQLAARSLLPIDWAQFRQARRRVGCEDNGWHGAGDERLQGLTIPVRGPTNSIWALLHATRHGLEAEWKAQRPQLIKELVHVAHYVHQRAHHMHQEEAPVDLHTMTRREIEAMEYIAEGKSVEATAASMRISAQTVKDHLDSARYKLQALNRAHAVTKAIRAGLIH